MLYSSSKNSWTENVLECSRIIIKIYLKLTTKGLNGRLLDYVNDTVLIIGNN